MKNIRARASYIAWRKYLHAGWTAAMYDRIHDFEVRKNGTCGAGCCNRCSGYA